MLQHACSPQPKQLIQILHMIKEGGKWLACQIASCLRHETRACLPQHKRHEARQLSHRSPDSDNVAVEMPSGARLAVEGLRAVICTGGHPSGKVGPQGQQRQRHAADPEEQPGHPARQHRRQCDLCSASTCQWSRMSSLPTFAMRDTIWQSMASKSCRFAAIDSSRCGFCSLCPHTTKQKKAPS